DKKLLLTFLIEGIPYESLTDDMILNNFNGQKETLLGLCKSEKVFLWEHLVKRDSPMDARYKFPDNPFLQRLSDFYCETFNGERSLRTEYFLTTGIPYDDIDAGEKKAKDIIRQIETGFKDYNIYTLGISEGCISDICTNYLNYLLNHDFEKIPLSATNISEIIKNSTFY
ncbi:type IV secretion system protein VirB4, partial [Escherichia coli]|nr:type IV secretion system protein VirB4 [Escherichia coli]